MSLLAFVEMDTPIGALRIALHEGQLCALAFVDAWPRIDRTLARRFGPTCTPSPGTAPEVEVRMRDYFAGDPTALDAVTVDPGGTAFQRAVWTALRRVPAGQTTTYAALAREIGSPAAVRAVGAANAANPVGIVVPCHRAIGSDGSLTGYAFGLDRKRWLLQHEKAAWTSHRRS